MYKIRIFFSATQINIYLFRPHQALRDQERIYIVTPFFGGELFDVLTDKGQFSEEEARPLFRQVLDALLHLKRHGVCHR